jgi:hypothetical protein
MLDLEAFAFGLGKRFVVGDLQYQTGDTFAKALDEIFLRYSDVLHRVVKNGCTKHVDVVYAADVREEIRYLERVVDVWFRIASFAEMTGVALSGETGRLE